METEALAPPSKTWRMEAPERQASEEILTHELQPAAADAPQSERTSRGQEPTHVSRGEGDGVDRISSLPDAVLGEIISLLPTKDAVRTQSLASRWRHLWLSAPFNLDHTSLPADEQVQVRIISRILAAHPGPARRFSVPPSLARRRLATVDAWLRCPALDSLQELEVVDEAPGGRYLWGEPPPLPAATFRFSATLRVVTFCRFDLAGIAETLHFPQLKQLGLERLDISDTALNSIIAGCPILEDLLIDNCIGFSYIRINSPSLRSIAMSCVNLIIEDAPSLQRLLNLDAHGALLVSVISASKLETLGCLSDHCPVSKLVFGTTVIQKLRADCFTTVASSVKILAISIINLSLDMVIGLMRCFPCLEKLYIKSYGAKDKNLWRRKHRNLARCLDIRLKTIVLKNYQGMMSQVNFATFFVSNARMLEFMRFEVRIGNDNKMFIAEQHRKLQLEKRASRNAQFCFTSRDRVSPY
ncbi:F-box/LRR-repeat protein At3g26922-like [Panicum virgatum]|uniref:F-box domain-containing protein n=1 Tax=Panicum virgatum TaxID=38727 RepID=A0A8T0TMS2_PANVG|nr:F-box/LRR-repeat protein At3g26922-like [Panicum virgatum]KAG2610375.1 hypothetical protein PVAP13_4KG188800 [Panicum virgatum]